MMMTIIHNIQPLIGQRCHYQASDWLTLGGEGGLQQAPALPRVPGQTGVSVQPQGRGGHQVSQRGQACADRGQGEVLGDRIVTWMEIVGRLMK